MGPDLSPLTLEVPSRDRTRIIAVNENLVGIVREFGRYLVEPRNCFPEAVLQKPGYVYILESRYHQLQQIAMD